jgi:hypothetical protein
VAVAADAEQALLQLAVVGEASGVDGAVDAAVDHDGDVFRHAVATPMFCSMTRMCMSLSRARSTRSSSTWVTISGARPSVGSSITSRRGLRSRAREIASICCSPPESWAPPEPRRSARRGKVE